MAGVIRVLLADDQNMVREGFGALLGGLAAAKLILDEAPGAPRVLMLTTFDLDEYVYAALRAGASGFLLKHAPASELLDAVRVVAAGDALLAPSVTKRLIADFVRPAGRAARLESAGRAARADAPGDRGARPHRQGMSNAEIAAEFVLAEQTVKTHVSAC